MKAEVYRELIFTAPYLSHAFETFYQPFLMKYEHPAVLKGVLPRRRPHIAPSIGSTFMTEGLALVDQRRRGHLQDIATN